MEYCTLIKNGTVVDGSGADAYAADVRVHGGRIVEIARDLTPAARERVVDASDCYVTPGFIEAHNHWDGAVWWSPNMEPYAGYGITTSINGNCGFSLAPLPRDAASREDIVDIFNFFEDIPEHPMRRMIPWDWHTWSEYKASFQRNVKVPVNFAAFCGHIPLRLAVMGQDAWTRAARRDEVEKMCALLDDALRAGAMGLSTNQLDYDKRERPLPSMLADDDEYLALMKVVANRPGATIEVILDSFMRMTVPEVVQRLGTLARQAGVPVQWAGGIPTFKFQTQVRERAELVHRRFDAEGLPFWNGFTHIEYMFSIDFKRTLLFAQTGNLVWQELVEITDDEEKLRTLADPAWRARARHSWDSQHEHNRMGPGALLLRESENGCGPVGVTLAQYMSQCGAAHPSDALADWVLANGTDSLVLQKGWEVDDDVVVRLLKDPQSVGNVSDGGAHGKMFCGAGDNALLLTEFVRERRVLTIEQGIHVLTGKLADFFGLADRGLLQVGKAADLVVFNLAEIERRPEEKLWDVPDGAGGRTYRYVRPPAPMRLTMVNGMPTFDHGAITGRFPGQFIGPSRAPVQRMAAA